jgi:hypothetical protein
MAKRCRNLPRRKTFFNSVDTKMLKSCCGHKKGSITAYMPLLHALKFLERYTGSKDIELEITVADLSIFITTHSGKYLPIFDHPC